MTVTPATWFDDDIDAVDEVVGTDHVVVRFSGGRYGVCAPDVAEVTALLGLTRVPGTPSWVCGVANWRGHVLPVVDLRSLLGVPVTPLPSSARIVVVSVDDVEVGVVAEAVAGLVAVPVSCAAPPATLTGDAAELIVGLADGGPIGPVAVLSTPAILALGSRTGSTRH